MGNSPTLFVCTFHDFFSSVFERHVAIAGSFTGITRQARTGSIDLLVFFCLQLCSSTSLPYTPLPCPLAHSTSTRDYSIIFTHHTPSTLDKHHVFATPTRSRLETRPRNAPYSRSFRTSRPRTLRRRPQGRTVIFLEPSIANATASA